MQRILIVDDHPLYREALRTTVQLALPAARIVEAATITCALERPEGYRGIDLILLDLSMQGVSGFDGLLAVRGRYPKVPVLIVSGRDEPQMIEDALGFGAVGFVSKSADKTKLIQAVRDAAARGFGSTMRLPPRRNGGDVASTLASRIARLTPQQFRVLLLIREGKLNKQIAYELDVGNSTVKAHVTEILRKLGVASRTQIVIETAPLNFDRPAA